MKSEKKLTIARSMTDFAACYRHKSPLLKREKEDFLWALGKQWSDEDKAKLEAAGFKEFTDNRIQPNIHLLTGLERQNRSEWKAFPEGEEDGVKSNIASALFKDAIKKSGFQYKSSDQFKDGITCGESHLELYLDNTEDMLNGKPCWRKVDGNILFWDPAAREYDFSDAAYVYKVTFDITREDLINLYPEKAKVIERASGGKLDVKSLLNTAGIVHTQKRDYPTSGGETDDLKRDEEGFDLIERYYKKWVKKVFLGDKETGEIRECKDLEEAEAFVADFRAKIVADQQSYEMALAQHAGAEDQAVLAAIAATPELAGQPILPEAVELLKGEMRSGGQLPPVPPAPPVQNPQRWAIIKRMIPEIWCFAHVEGIKEPLADERAWFYPKWKSYPFVPYFARFSTAPLTGDDRHLLIQGVVHGVKGAQERHNKAEMLMLRHLNSSANSGWLAEEGSWSDETKVEQFGSVPGINLYYKRGKKRPERITPSVLSVGHERISEGSAEAIKAQLGINADLLAVQQGGSDSGRAIALRQKQGILMVQEPFDNLSRTRQIAGRMILSLMGDMYDTETAFKVLGDAFLVKNFPPVMLDDPMNPGQKVPMPGPDGRPMKYDRQLAEVTIAEVLSGELEKYDVSVGEAVASESQRMAQQADLEAIASKIPLPPDLLVKHSQLPEATKTEILQAIQKAQAMATVSPKAAPNAPDAAA